MVARDCENGPRQHSLRARWSSWRPVLVGRKPIFTALAEEDLAPDGHQTFRVQIPGKDEIEVLDPMFAGAQHGLWVEVAGRGREPSVERHGPHREVHRSRGFASNCPPSRLGGLGSAKIAGRVLCSANFWMIG